MLYNWRGLNSVLEDRDIINTSKNIHTLNQIGTELSTHRHGFLQTGAIPFQLRVCYIITTFAILDNLKRKCKIFKKTFTKEDVKYKYKPPKMITRFVFVYI